MIEKLKEGEKKAFGFKATGQVTVDEVKAFEPQLELFLSRHPKHPIGVLVDLASMLGSDWKARWEEIRFLGKHQGRIARVAVIGAHKWEEVMTEILAGTVLVEADTRYFVQSEIIHAWHWVKTARHAEEVPVRQICPPGGLMSGYEPEYLDV